MQHAYFSDKIIFFTILELFIKSKQHSQFENIDRSVSISIINEKTQDLDFQLIFFTISNINITQLLNSRIVSLNLLPKDLLIDNIHIIFRHLNESNQIPTCVYLKHTEK